MLCAAPALLDAFAPLLRPNEPLAGRTSFRIGGPAEWLLEPATEEEFAGAWATACRAGLPVHVLGGGSNLLVSDAGVPGVVFSTRQLDGKPHAQGSRVSVRAGTRLAQLVSFAAQAGLAGLEGLAGIPGTVGGAVRMNAGGRHGTIGPCVAAVRSVDRAGSFVTRPGSEITWAYRSMDLDEPIVAVELALTPEEPRLIRERITANLAAKRTVQPTELHSAGCFFRNPPGESAGRLIEAAGLKGARVGEACVSEKHANFIVNLGQATAADVRALAERVRDGVRARFHLSLEPEVRYWPETRA